MNWRSSEDERLRSSEMNGRTRVTSRAIGLLITVMLMAGAQELVAQRRGGGGGQRQQMERRIQALFDNMVREELGLSEDQVQALQDVVDDFRLRRLEFSQNERNSRLRVARLGRGGGGGGGAELTEQEASEILAEMLALSGEEAVLFREEQEAFLQILSPRQVVRFIVMRQALGDRIRGLRGGGGRGRGLQGGGRPGGPRR